MAYVTNHLYLSVMAIIFAIIGSTELIGLLYNLYRHRHPRRLPTIR